MNLKSKITKIIKAVAFLLILAVMLRVLSVLAVDMGRNRDAMNDYAPVGLSYEPDNTIDVLTIGSSSIYCSVSPLNWWVKYGYTGYTWGEPCQRIFEAYEALQQVYRHQTPKVVFLEVGGLYWDYTDIQAWDSMVKARMQRVFPVIAYHNNLSPGGMKNLGAPHHSLAKGYLYHGEAVPPGQIVDYMQPDDGGTEPIPKLCIQELGRCISFCRSKGSAVVLFSVPEHKGWNMKMHREIANLAADNQTEYLDLNLALRASMDWSTDTVDGGIHLNAFGAKKVTDYLGKYLTDHFQLTDHRGDSAYAAWDTDWQTFSKHVDKTFSVLS